MADACPAPVARDRAAYLGTLLVEVDAVLADPTTTPRLQRRAERLRAELEKKIAKLRRASEE